MSQRVETIRGLALALAATLTLGCSQAKLAANAGKSGADDKQASESKADEKTGSDSSSPGDPAAPPDAPEWMPLHGFSCATKAVDGDKSTVACEVTGAKPSDDVRKSLSATWSVTGLADKPAAIVASPELFKVEITGPTKAFLGRSLTLTIAQDGKTIYRRTLAFTDTLLVAPPYAVTRKNFAVWTEPLDPIPNAPYDVFIGVRLGPGVTSYEISDITGDVRGSDGYRQRLEDTPGKTMTFHPEHGGARIKIPVKGSKADGVKDEIEVDSHLLDEYEVIEVVF